MEEVVPTTSFVNYEDGLDDNEGKLRITLSVRKKIIKKNGK
jgi:hypothetical protein